MQYTVTTPIGTKDITIEWPANFKKVAILVSGGFDSALLLWLYANLQIPEGCSLLAVTTDRGRGAKEFAKNIVKLVSEQTGTRIEHVILPVAPMTDHSIQVRGPVRQALDRKMFDCAICADTTNPDIELNGVAPNRLPVEEQHTKTQWRFPFLHVDKSYTVQLVNDLGLDWVMELSHTCTESSAYRCNTCWQCQERAWAFNQTNLIDIGKF